MKGKSLVLKGTELLGHKPFSENADILELYRMIIFQSKEVIVGHEGAIVSHVDIPEIINTAKIRANASECHEMIKALADVGLLDVVSLTGNKAELKVIPNRFFSFTE